MAKRLTISKTDKRIAGVCGGIAEYMDVDPVLVRAIFVTAAIMSVGLVAYVVLWIMMPLE